MICCPFPEEEPPGGNIIHGLSDVLQAFVAPPPAEQPPPEQPPGGNVIHGLRDVLQAFVAPPPAEQPPPEQAPGGNVIHGLRDVLQDFVLPAQPVEQHAAEDFDPSQFVEVPSQMYTGDNPVLTPLTEPFTLDFNNLLPSNYYDTYQYLANAVDIPSNADPNSFFEVAVQACDFPSLC
jgi:hypothetical protein